MNKKEYKLLLIIIIFTIILESKMKSSTVTITNSTVVSKKQKIAGKSFRLIDYNVYNETINANKSSSEEGSVNSNEKKYAKYDQASFVIQMFGVNEKGETCCIYVNDYKPFFFVKVDDEWTPQKVGALLSQIKKEIGKYYEASILNAELVEHCKLYGFSAGKQYKFVKLTFKNTTVMNKVKNLWYDYSGEYRKYVNYRFPPRTGLELELYESGIPPLLRYFHINNISPSGWVYIPVSRVYKPPIKNTTCTYEYICASSQLIPMPQKETRVPYKICSFDIEASSSHGDFPVPKKDYKRLATNIVDCFIKQMQIGKLEESRAKLLLQKTILTAFGYGRFEDIDLVYPKKPISKENVQHCIKILLEHTIYEAKQINADDDKRQLLTITSAFEKIQQTQQYFGSGNGEDDDGDSDDEGGPAGDVVENEIPNSPNKRQNTYKSSSSKIENKLKLMDILISDNYKREEKINQLNEILTMLFPRLEGDKVTFIGSTFMRYGETEPYLNHCLVLGDCDAIAGVEVDCVTEERDLLLKWTELIQSENPDIVIGYNIFGFDYEFMFRRSEELHCEQEFLKLSRKQNELSANENNNGTITIENTKIQIASGEYDLRYYKMTGRLQIDMYAYFRRDFNLSSYKLDDVAGQFISDDIKKIKHTTTQNSDSRDMTELYTQNITGLHIGDYIHIELSSFTTDYYKNGKKFQVVDILRQVEVQETVKGKEVTNTYNVIMIEGHHHIDSGKSIRWGMAKDDVTPQDIFRLSKGSASDRAIVAKYCIQDCNLVHHLMNKIDVITGYVEMSNICSVPISFLVFRGQGIKLTSYVAKKCREKNTLMPDLEKKNDHDGYEGAIVLPPKCSMYMDNPVACVDYSSLYPSSMISQTYSHDSKVWMKEYNNDGKLIRISGERDEKGRFVYDNLPGYQYINIEFDNFKYLRNPANPSAKAVKTKVGKIVCRWAQFPDNKKGIMPSILEELLKARSDTRKLIKTEKDPFMQNILDKRQLGYKVTANSLYGQCGSKTSTFYEKDVAASTTATGRMMITYGRRIIEEVYGNRVYNTICKGPVVTKAEYVYGDTDSVFFTFNLEDVKTGEKIRGQDALEITIEIAQDAAKLCSQWLKPPMDLSYEKTLMPFILLSKKRYVGMLYETDPNKGKMKYMGLSLKRRDSCDYLKDTYGGILTILMKDNNLKKALDFLDKSLNQLIDGKVSMDKLMITKALRSDYKNPNQIAHKVLADRIGARDPGNKPKPGDRMKFLHIVTNKKKALQGEKIETPEFILQENLKIDYDFYITNQLMKPLQQLFGLAVEQIMEDQRKNHDLKVYKNDLDNLLQLYGDDLETYMKKREKLASTHIKTLLFDQILTKIYNRNNRLQDINTFFRKQAYAQ